MYSHKGEYFVYICHILSYILPREPKDKHCVLQCTHTSQNIHDAIPLDKSKNHTALTYITWGLIWDFKNKKSQLSNLLPDCHPRFQKGKKKSLNLLLPLKNVKFITGLLSEIPKKERRKSLNLLLPDQHPRYQK